MLGLLGAAQVHFDTADLVAAMAAALVGAAAQAVCGFGFSLVSAPVFVQLVGAARAVRMANLLAVTVNVAVLIRYRRGVRVGVALGLLAPALVVTPLVAYVVHRTDAGVLEVVVGVLIVASAGFLASGRRWHRLRGRAGLLGAGALSAAMNTASGVGGPAVAMYALNAEWGTDMSRPTMQVYFLGLNVISFLALGGLDIRAGDAAALVGAIAVGLVVGAVAAKRLSAPLVGQGVVLLSIVGGIAAIVRGVGHL